MTHAHAGRHQWLFYGGAAVCRAVNYVHFVLQCGVLKSAGVTGRILPEWVTSPSQGLSQRTRKLSMLTFRVESSINQISGRRAGVETPHR